MLKNIFKLLIFRNFYIIILINFIGCQNQDKDCLYQNIAFGNEQFKVKGCLENQLEEGKWKFFDNKNNLIEEGFFINGIRNGKWIYPNRIDSVIYWGKFIKESNELEFNIPKGLEIVEQDSSFIKFSNKDSTKLFNLVLAVTDVVAGFNINQYHKEIEKEISKTGQLLNSDRKKLEAENIVFYHDVYTMKSLNHDSVKLVSVYGIIGDKYFEFGCQYPSVVSSSANIIFFSVISNIFYRQKRIINPFNEIKSIKNSR